MINIIKANTSIWHKIYVTVLFVVTAILLYLALPQSIRFRYEFQKGRPWMHETLIAPMDFAIMKSEEEIKEEQDSVLNSLLPYFSFYDSIGKKNLTGILLSVDIIIKENNLSYSEVSVDDFKNRLSNIYNSAFSKGVLEQSPSNYPSLYHKESLIVVEDKVASRVPVENIRSLKSAYNFISGKISEISVTNPEWAPILSKLAIEDFLVSNLFYDEDATGREQEERLGKISFSRGMVQEGERIVSKGELISPQTYQILESLRYTYRVSYGAFKEHYIVVLGRVLFVIIALIVIFLFFVNIRKEVLSSKRDITFALLMMVAMIALCRVVVSSNVAFIYLVPFTIFALVINTFLKARIAIFMNTIAALIVGFMVPNGYEFVLLQVIAGSIAVISQTKLQRRSQLFITSLFIFLAYALTYISISLIQEGNFSSINWIIIKLVFFNSVLTLITYFLVYIFEKTFGFVSDVTLAELSYSNHNLLRKLAEEAPGTFQHSMQVANLAEDAITKLGGNPLLVRAGAMYHDIGKTVSPHYFTENQSLGMNPHEGHSFEESASIIMSHVADGVKLARKYKIPEPVIDFIRSHHGTTKTGYFYIMSRNANNKEKIDESNFTYPGPVPATKETAVVMLADSVEAASRSLKDKTRETLTAQVETIFNSKIEGEQLIYSPLTFRDISILKEIFLEKLLNIYHIRVEYPGEDKTVKQ
jgi:putative nucleotidyltransferase with HDIG domain